MSTPTYSIAERDRRWNLARTFMDREGLGALLIFGEHEDAGPAPVNYDTWFTNGRPGSTVVFSRAGEPISLFAMPLFVLDHLESSRRGDTMWIAPQNIRNSYDSFAVAKILNELGLAEATIGVIGLEAYPPWHPEGIIPYHFWNKILQQFPKANFKSVDHALAYLIMPQSEEEIAVIRHSASIGDAMVRAMVEKAAAGVLESEVYAAGMSAGFAHGAVPSPMHFWSGPDPVATGWPQWGYRPQSPRTLQDGDVITSELFCNFGGRHTQHQVTIAIGEVHEDYERAAKVARAMYDAGLEALRPGRKFGDFVDDMLKPAEKAGGWVMGPAVHALNPLVAVSRFPGDVNRLPGTEAYPPGSDQPTVPSDMEIKPGTSFAFEPNYAFGRHVVHLGGTVIVGEDGPIELNSYTAQILKAAGKNLS